MRVRIFDDGFSLIHALLGFVAGILPFKFSLFIIIAFALYEIVENKVRGEPKGSLVGDTIEFFIGFLFGLVTIMVFL